MICNRPLVLLLSSALAAVAIAAEPPASPPPKPAVPSSAITAEFEARAKEYLALQEKLDSQLPRLQKESTPEQIVEHQRALAAKIKAARPNPKPGEFFTPALQDLVRKVLKIVLAGTDGKRIRSSIMDENPDLPKIGLYEPYPSSVPLSTMPPQVLEELPDVDPILEYRFLGRRLILLDTRADLVLDYTEAVIPR